MNTTQMIVRRAVTASVACACSSPIAVERAERKGAAVVVCLRCGYRVPQRLPNRRR